MLLVFMQLAGMLGGVIPPIPTPHGGGETMYADEGYSGKKRDEEKEVEDRLKRLRQDDEDILIILSQFITSNNSN